MRIGLAKQVSRTLGGVWTAIRSRRKVFGLIVLGVFALNLVLPVIVLSLARKPPDLFTFNPWLSRLPEYLASSDVPLSSKVGFLSDMALAWVIAEHPIDGVEWGFIVDVPSLARFLLTGALFGAYFALWSYRRGQLKSCGMGTRTARHAGAAGAVTSVLGFTTGPCSVMGCGVPVLPVVGLAFTGLSSTMLTFFAEASRVAIGVVLSAVAVGVAWQGWLAGSERPAA